MILSSNAGQAISRHILVAEDNKAFQDIVSGFLEFLGFEVALAGNGIEALAIFIESIFDFGFDRPSDASHGRFETGQPDQKKIPKHAGHTANGI
jgi:hypothetical protein